MRVATLPLALTVLLFAACDDGGAPAAEYAEGPPEAVFIGSDPVDREALTAPQPRTQPVAAAAPAAPRVSTPPADPTEDEGAEPTHPEQQDQAAAPPAADPAPADPVAEETQLTGRILDAGTMTTRDGESRLAVRVETAEGEVVVVDLGPADRGVKPRFRAGQTLRARGRLLADQKPHPLLIASSFAASLGQSRPPGD